MAHTFDTGLAKPQRTLIRESITARLEPLLTVSDDPKYLAAIKALPRQLRGEGDDDGMAMLIEAARAKAPCVLVSLGRWRRTNAHADPLELVGELDVTVYVVSTNGRDLVVGRLEQDAAAEASDTADPGVETMLEHVVERLNGQQLKDDDGEPISGVKEPVLTDEDETATFADLSIWELKFTLEVERIVNPNRDATEVVTSIQGEHEESGTVEADGGLDIAPIVTLANLEPETP